jgi:uridylate kinase
MLEPIVESAAKVDKVRIPGRNQTDASMFVNAKQARRMLIIRQKRVKKFL